MARSSSTAGANGRKPSRFLTCALRWSRISARRGSARIERLPSARGPISKRPWNQPTILPSARSCATRRSICASGMRRYCRPALSSACRMLVVAVGLAVEGMRHLEAARMAQRLVVVPQRAAERGAGVGRARRHPDAPHVGLLEDLGVGDAVEGDAADHAQVAHRELLEQRRARRRRTISSVTACRAKATSRCRSSSGSSGRRAGPNVSRNLRLKGRSSPNAS